MATRSTPSIKDAVAAYLDDRLEEVAESTHSADRNLLDRLVAFLPDKQIGRLTADDLSEFFKALRRGDPKAGGCKGYSGNSLAIAQVRIRGFIAYQHRKGWGRGDLMDGMKRPVLEGRRDFLRLSADELLRMLENAKHPRDRALLAAGMNTGLRAGELINLKAGQFDLDKGEFFVAITKSKTSDVMPITSDLDAELRRWLKFYADECGPVQGSWFLFPSVRSPLFVGGEPGATGPRRIRPEMRYAQPRRVAKDALLSLGYTSSQLQYEGFHTLRRSVARLYFDAIREAGYDFALRETSALLHHKNTQTTELYLGIDVERENRNSRMRGKPFLTGMIAADAAKLREAN